MKVKCLNCNKEFEKSNSQIKRSPNHYCSRSCAASVNNRKKPRRTKTRKCKLCDTLIFKHRTYCDKHKHKTIDYTLAECIYEQHHKSSAYSLVRARARTVAKKLGWNTCRQCGYSKHVEIAHIKPISEYPEDTKISIINHPDNLIPLCPNCHWEFDH